MNVRRDSAAAAAVADEIESAGGRAIAVVGDVGDRDEVFRAVGECTAALGDVTAAIHCAAYRSHGRLRDLTLAEWRQARRVSLDGAFFLVQATLPSMLDAGFGRYVLIGGSGMNTGLPLGHGHVAAAKAALRGFVRAVSQEAGRHGVTANVVSPGTIDTETRRSVVPVLEGWNPVEATALGRMITMDELAELCVYLCRPEAAIINGQVLNADGGTYAFGE